MKEVAKKENSLFVTDDQMTDEMAAMMTGEEEQLSKDDLQIPMLKIAQKGSPQVDPDQAEYIEGLKPGMYFSTATGTVFGESIKIQSLVYFRNFVIWQGEKGQGEYKGTLSVEEFEAMEKELASAGTPLVRDSGDFVHAGAGEEGKELRYTDTRNFAVVLPEFMSEGMMVYPMSSTGIKPSKIWNSKNRSRRRNGQPVKRHATIWELTTDGFKKDNYSWKQVSTINPLGWANAELFTAAEALVDIAKTYKDSEALKYSEESHPADDIEESDF